MLLESNELKHVKPSVWFFTRLEHLFYRLQIVCVFAVRLYCVYKKAAARVTAEIMWSEDVNSVSTQIL